MFLKMFISSAIALSLLSVYATPAHAKITAKDHGFEQQCNVQMEGNLVFEDHLLTITTENDEIIVINAHHELVVNGKSVNLSTKQKQWLKSYYADIEKIIPLTADVALKGIGIARSVTSDVLAGLLGNGSMAIKDLNKKLNGWERALRDHVYANPNSVTFNSVKFEKELGFTRDWETSFEKELEGVMQVAIGEFLLAIGREMLSGEGNANETIEQRMTRISNEVEEKIGGQAEILKADAKSLCNALEKLDDAEDMLQREVEVLKQLDIIRVYNQA